MHKLQKLFDKVKSPTDRMKVRATMAQKEVENISEVARHFRVTRQTIHNWLNTPEKYISDPVSRPGSKRGRSWKWTIEMDTLLERSLKKHPHEFGISISNWTIPVLILHFYQETGLQFSRATFPRKLHNL